MSNQKLTLVIYKQFWLTEYSADTVVSFLTVLQCHAKRIKVSTAAKTRVELISKHSI